MSPYRTSAAGPYRTPSPPAKPSQRGRGFAHYALRCAMVGVCLLPGAAPLALCASSAADCHDEAREPRTRARPWRWRRSPRREEPIAWCAQPTRSLDEGEEAR